MLLSSIYGLKIDWIRIISILCTWHRWWTCFQGGTCLNPCIDFSKKQLIQQHSHILSALKCLLNMVHYKGFLGSNHSLILMVKTLINTSLFADVLTWIMHLEYHPVLSPVESVLIWHEPRLSCVRILNVMTSQKFSVIFSIYQVTKSA